METVPVLKKEFERFQFYQFPKWLCEKPFNSLPSDAKLIYTFLYNRLDLSIRNKWYDKQGKLYIYFKNEKLAYHLGISEKTVIAAKKKLAELGLLSEVRQGVSLPNRLYIHAPIFDDVTDDTTNDSVSEDNSVQELENVQTGTVETTVQELKNLQFSTEESTVLDLKNLQTTNTKNTNNSNSSCINKYDFKNLVKDFEKYLGRFISPFELEDLEKWVKEEQFDVDVIREALREAVLNNKVFMKYINGILGNWKRSGLLTVEAVKAHQAERLQELPKNVQVSPEFLEAMDLWKN
ncbi:TPA: DnaD domain protein [Streptococcus suis]